VTGVDRSPALLDLARRSDETAPIRWEHCDMRDLPWTNEFDAVVCWWGSFGYFDEAGNQGFLDSVARVLRPSGRFVLDLHTTETIFPVFQPRGWHRVGEHLVLEERQWDHTSGHIRSTWTFVSEGHTNSKEALIRVYSYARVVEMLETAGFTEVTGIDQETGDDFQLGARRLVLLADK
jgi:ubiquinone/menaquinone biosynthesis C-methylase UbiE